MRQGRGVVAREAGREHAMDYRFVLTYRSWSMGEEERFLVGSPGIAYIQRLQ